MSKSTIGWKKNGNNDQVLETKLPELEKENVLVEQLNFEIECPRCSEVMELSSEFDYLSYYCRGCHLELGVH